MGIFHVGVWGRQRLFLGSFLMGSLGVGGRSWDHSWSHMCVWELVMVRCLERIIDEGKGETLKDRIGHQ